MGDIFFLRDRENVRDHNIELPSVWWGLGSNLDYAHGKAVHYPESFC